MNRQSTQKLRLDRRLIDRRDWISKAERDAAIEALSDVAHKGMSLGDAEDEAKPPAADAPAAEPAAAPRDPLATD